MEVSSEIKSTLGLSSCFNISKGDLLTIRYGQVILWNCSLMWSHNYVQMSTYTHFMSNVCTFLIFNLIKVMWRVMQPSMVSHTQNLCFAYRSGRKLGVRSLAQGHLRWGNEGGRECWAFILPTYSTFSCQYWDSDPRPMGYKSDSLTISHNCPLIKVKIENKWAIADSDDTHFVI